MVRADVELGGTDQTFNLLVGRDLQRTPARREQVAVVDAAPRRPDGVQKMSKSLGNHIGVGEPPEEMYGKVMSISDDLMLRYYELLSRLDAEARAAVAGRSVHPMEAKKNLAHELVGRFHGPARGRRGRAVLRRSLPAAVGERPGTSSRLVSCDPRRVDMPAPEGHQLRRLHLGSAAAGLAGRRAGRRRARRASIFASTGPGIAWSRSGRRRLAEVQVVDPAGVVSAATDSTAA